MKIFRLGLLIILAGAGAVQGDIMGVSGRGETVWPVNNKHIEMTEEKVVIRYQLDQDRFFADCLFMLRNTGPATKIQVGFPGSEDRVRSLREGKYVSETPDFRVWVNQHEYPTEIRTKKRPLHGQPLSEHNYDRVYAWTMSFKAGQTCTVRTTYSFYGTTYTAERGADYVLKTGKLWKGPIGKAEIVVQGVPSEYLSKIRPGGYFQRGDTITWHFESFEPDNDIYVEANIQPLVWINKSEQMLAENNPTSDTLFLHLERFTQMFHYEPPYGPKIPKAQMEACKERLLRKMTEGPEKDYFLYQDCLEKGDTSQAVTRWISSLQSKWRGKARWQMEFGGNYETERFKVLSEPNPDRWPQTDSFTRQNAALNPDTGRYVRCLRAVEEYYQKGGISYLRPQAKDNWQTLGSKYRSVGRFEEAMRCYERALNPDQHVREFKGNSPDEPRLFLDMGQTMLLAGDTTRATTYIQRAASTTTPWLKKQAVELLKQIQKKQKGGKK